MEPQNNPNQDGGMGAGQVPPPPMQQGSAGQPTPPAEKRSFSDDIFANLSFGAGVISIGTDLLGIFSAEFWFISTILEITAIVLGVIALAKGQNKGKAAAGIVMGAIGLVALLIFS